MSTQEQLVELAKQYPTHLVLPIAAGELIALREKIAELTQERNQLINTRLEEHLLLAALRESNAELTRKRDEWHRWAVQDREGVDLLTAALVKARDVLQEVSEFDSGEQPCIASDAKEVLATIDAALTK